MSATSDNSRHTATLRSAKIRQSRTSYVRKTLDDIALEGEGYSAARQKRGNVQMELNFVSISYFVVIARLCVASLYPADTGLLCHSDPG